MTPIEIERPHQLDATAARALVDRVAAALTQEFDVTCQWNGDVLEWVGSGMAGAIALAADRVRVTARLPPWLRPLRGTIERHIESRLDRYLA